MKIAGVLSEGEMGDGHRGHLFSSLLAVEEVARQMERAGRDGRSPTSGQALTPLASTEWEALAAPLTRMQERLHEMLRRLAPERLAARGEAEGRATTLYWLSVLLRRLEEEIVDELDPARTERKFGGLGSEERELLARLVEDLRAEMATMRAQIESLRKGGG